MIVIVGTRAYLGAEAFNAWGWRIPFLLSFLLVAIAIYIRLQLQETPIFEEIKARGQLTRNPWKEAFLGPNLKFVLIASLVVIGQGVVWYSSQFWALYFLQQVSKVDVVTSSYIVGLALLVAAPTLILFGALSDKIGRKPVILGGFLLAALTYYPLYSWLGTVTHPGKINYPDRDLHHFYPRQLRRDGVRADRRVPGRILPRPDPLHVGVGPVSHRQRLGRRLGAAHHLGGLPGDGQPRRRADLPDRGSGPVLRTLPLPDAGDAPHQHLEANRGSNILARLLMRGTAWPRAFFPTV